MSTEPIAVRQLYSNDECLELAIGRPEKAADGTWSSVVTMSTVNEVLNETVFGADAFDVLINALKLCANDVAERGRNWARFPSESEPWHWIPVIPPILSRAFNDDVTEAIQAIHADHCLTRKRR